MVIYRLFWDEFSSWYLEMIKPVYGQPIDEVTYQATLDYFEKLLELLHPFMPFITEELWQHITSRKEGESIMIAPVAVPHATDADHKLAQDMEVVKNIVAGVRAIRNQKNISPKDALELCIIGNNDYAAYNSVMLKMANLSTIKTVSEKETGSASFMVGTTEYSVPIGNLIDVDAEIKKLEGELKHLEGFLAGVQKKLGNANFVAHAPEKVVEMERKKQADAETKIAAVKASLAELKK